MLLLTSWRGRLHGMVLPIACLLSVLWAAALAYHASHDFALSLVTNLEIARNAGWSAFLITLLGLNRDGFFNGRMNPAMSIIVALYVGCVIAAFYAHGNLGIFPAHTSDYTNSIITSVAMALLEMILVEQLYRNTPVKQRWGIKFACLGMAVFLVRLIVRGNPIGAGTSRASRPRRKRMDIPGITPEASNARDQGLVG